MATARDDLIATTGRLMEQQGYHATGMNQIIRESGACKGSVYYYFPEGKRELARRAIEQAAAGIAVNIAGSLAADDPARHAVPAFIRELAGQVVALNFRGGGPITLVALEAATTDESLRLACRDAYRAWQGLFADRLRPEYGPRAERLAAVILSAIEGAIVLARSEHSAQPLLDVADEMALLLAADG